MKLSLPLGAAALLVALLGCGSNKPETVPAKPGPPKTAEDGSATGSQETGPKETTSKETGSSSTTTELPASKETKPTTAGPKEPPKHVSDEFRALVARVVEKSPQGAWRINEVAALEIEKLGDGAQADLIALMSDPKAEVRRGAAYYLLANFQPEDEKQVAGYSALLEDAEPFLRGLGLQAVRRMAKTDQAAAVPRLAKMLVAKQEPSPDNRAALARLLGSFKQDAAPALAALTSGAQGDESPKVRGAYLVAISQIASPKEALPAFRQGLSDQDASVRLVAAARLRQLGKDAAPAADELAQGLEDADPRVRESAAEALAGLGSAAVEPICQHVDSKTAHTRQLAIACLGKLGPAAKSALPLVEKHLTDSDSEVKTVAEAVARILKGS